jgi:hypothetical protein
MAPSRAVVVAAAGGIWKSHTHWPGLAVAIAPAARSVLRKSEHLGACSTLLASAEPDQSKDSAVRQAANNRKLTEILVECNQDASFDTGCLQNRFVAGIRLPVAARGNIVTTRLQVSSRAAPNTRVEQQLHAVLGSITKGSMRS